MRPKPFKTICLIRHCKAESQQADAKLTSEGIAQASRLVDFLHAKEIEYIISSSYQRAIATIEPLAEKKSLKINTDARLVERILSSEMLHNWEEKLKETFQDLHLRLPGGETSFEAMERGIAVLKELLERPEKSIAVVTHGNLMCLMLRYYDPKYGFDEWKNLTNPDVFELRITYENEIVQVRRVWGF